MRGGAQRPVWRVNEPKKTGARSARVHTLGQNTLAIKIPKYCRTGNADLKHLGSFKLKSVILKLNRQPDDFCIFKNLSFHYKILMLLYLFKFPKRHVRVFSLFYY